MMKIFLTFCLGFLLLPNVLHAQSDYRADLQTQLEATAGEQGANFGTPNDPRTVVANVIKVILSFLGIGFVAYMVYAGSLIMFSNGEEEKMTKGRNILKNSIIGLIIILSAYGITILAYKIASGDIWHQGNYLEIEKARWTNPDPYSTPPPNVLPNFYQLPK